MASDILDKLTEKNAGYLSTKDAVASDVSRTTVSAYVKNNDFERVTHGLYLSPEYRRDPYYELQFRYPGAVFSHETALYLLSSPEREPAALDVTLHSGAGSATLSKEGFRVHKVRENLIETGLCNIGTPYGHTVRCYNIERTLCDLVRNRSKGDKQQLLSALKDYFRRKNRDIPLLMAYAKEFSVDNILRGYLEVIL